MDAAEYERLREHERGYWWHVARRTLLESLLAWGVPPDPRRPALDIGCGTGENFAFLAPYGHFFGTEVTIDLYRDGRSPVRPVALARGEDLPLADASLGLCTFFDVLEHVPNEDAMLTEVARVLRPGGLAVLSVPAYMSLWSEHDVSLHHYRRYDRGTLRRAFARNGLEVVRITYAMASILPAVALYRWFTRLRPSRGPAGASYVPTPEPLNRWLIGVLGWEARALRWTDLAFGTSLLALVRKGTE
jgi:SAM-dependent methyltransferase